MPVYDYECEKFCLRTEISQNFSDPPITECPQCSGRLKRLIAPPAIIFKGSGWYVTDFPSKDRKQGIEGEKGCAEGKKTEKASKATDKENVKV